MKHKSILVIKLGALGDFIQALGPMAAIRAYHKSRGEEHRNICLIPSSAHGTNPASAVMAGMKVVVTKAADDGNIDVDDLRAKAEEHKENLAALMVTRQRPIVIPRPNSPKSQKCCCATLRKTPLIFLTTLMAPPKNLRYCPRECPISW